MNNNVPGCKSVVYNICKEKTRKTVLLESTPIIKINIEYPSVDSENGSFSERFNVFYKNIASNYAKYCEQTLSKKIDCRRKKVDSFRPYGEIMRYFVSLNSEKYISVVLEITHYDGYFSTCSRISHVWDSEKGIILPAEFFLRKMKLSVRSLRREIYKIIYERIKEGGQEFHYTESRIKRFAGRVNPDNFFLVEGGIAFWFPIGTIAPESEGFPAYVIKTDSI